MCRLRLGRRGSASHTVCPSARSAERLELTPQGPTSSRHVFARRGAARGALGSPAGGPVSTPCTDVLGIRPDADRALPGAGDANALRACSRGPGGAGSIPARPVERVSGAGPQAPLAATRFVPAGAGCRRPKIHRGSRSTTAARAAGPSWRKPGCPSWPVARPQAAERPSSAPTIPIVLPAAEHVRRARGGELAIVIKRRCPTNVAGGGGAPANTCWAYTALNDVHGPGLCRRWARGPGPSAPRASTPSARSGRCIAPTDLDPRRAQRRGASSNGPSCGKSGSTKGPHLPRRGPSWARGVGG